MAVATTVPTGSTLWTKAFWKGAAERAIKTFAQSVVGTFALLEGASLLAGPQLEQALSLTLWQMALLGGLVNAVLSVFTSIGNADFVAGTTASVPASAAIGLAAPAPEAIAIPDGDGEHRAAPAGSTATPVIHEN